MVIDVRLLAAKAPSELVINLINHLEVEGRKYASQPEYGFLMSLLAEARKLAMGVGTDPVGTSNNGGALYITNVRKAYRITIPADIVRLLGLRPGRAVVRVRANGRVVEYTAGVFRGSNTTLYTIVTKEAREALGVGVGSPIEVLMIRQAP